MIINQENASEEFLTGSSSEEPVIKKSLELFQIIKNFPGVKALDKVNFDLLQGEVHALFGENGSGKSTLINIISGNHQKDSGEMRYFGKEIIHNSPKYSHSIGISTVFQEFSLVPNMTVEENLFLGREITKFGIMRKKYMHERGEKILNELNFHIKLESKVGTLSRANQQMTEICKAMLQDVKVLILDEPTASLTERETNKLFSLLKKLKKMGVGIIYVSHRIAEIRQITDRITVLRDGKKINTVCTNSITDDELVEMMTGRKIGDLYPKINHQPKEVVLETSNLSVSGKLDKINIYVRKGEITGIAGLAGGGKSLIARTIFGLERISGGAICYKGEKIINPSPAMMLAKGICYFPSDRAKEGLAKIRSVKENITMACLNTANFSSGILLKTRDENKRAKEMIKIMDIRTKTSDVPVMFLSGGNQQKVVLTRGLLREANVFIFDDPTIGIDVGAKKEIYSLIKQFAENGAAVLFISSELMEVINLSNRVYVASEGRIVNEFVGEQITEKNVITSFFALKE